MSSVIEAIHTRRSCRTFSDSIVEPEKLERLAHFFSQNNRGPFGNRIRFQFLESTLRESGEIRNLTTYGSIKGARLFVVGSVPNVPRAMEDFGYCLERVILEATELGISTCWLGGTFKRSEFATEIGLGEKDLLPAVTPVGYPADRPSVMESIYRLGAGSKNRKSWEKLFFLSDFTQPLYKDQCGKYGKVLESVRVGPSASNKQPWRIVKERDTDRFDFYLKPDKNYRKKFEPISIQHIDMGIAMSHFELSAKELGIEGNWTKEAPDRACGDHEYIVTWTVKQSVFKRRGQ